jgi:hypothetical protein
MYSRWRCRVRAVEFSQYIGSGRIAVVNNQLIVLSFRVEIQEVDRNSLLKRIQAVTMRSYNRYKLGNRFFCTFWNELVTRPNECPTRSHCKRKSYLIICKARI